MEDDFLSLHKEILENIKYKKRICDMLYQGAVSEYKAGHIPYEELMLRIELVKEEEAKTKEILERHAKMLGSIKIEKKR